MRIDILLDAYLGELAKPIARKGTTRLNPSKPTRSSQLQSHNTLSRNRDRSRSPRQSRARASKRLPSSSDPSRSRFGRETGERRLDRLRSTLGACVPVSGIYLGPKPSPMLERQMVSSVVGTMLKALTSEGER